MREGQDNITNVYLYSQTELVRRSQRLRYCSAHSRLEATHSHAADIAVSLFIVTLSALLYILPRLYTVPVYSIGFVHTCSNVISYVTTVLVWGQSAQGSATMW